MTYAVFLKRQVGLDCYFSVCVARRTQTISSLSLLHSCVFAGWERKLQNAVYRELHMYVLTNILMNLLTTVELA